ncbi:MAG: bifunctional 4-hydroxy-2-oxoglutarate aldolase/2-dehydro-3-deoxy-phosphogluconate aldolase [Actinomycetes bacterium]
MTVRTSRPSPTPQLVDTGVVAILRAASGDRFVDVAATLAGAGVTCLEVTLTTAGALDAVRAVRDRLPDAVSVGVGTVTSVADVHAAVDAGAEFLVSPGVSMDVVTAGLARGVPSYPGAWTATEVLTAWRAGASAVKLFPAATGGPAHLRHLRGPLPDVPLVPTGGVALDDIAAYVQAGAVAVGLGGPLQGDAAEGGSLDALADRAARALAAVRAARSEGGAGGAG